MGGADVSLPTGAAPEAPNLTLEARAAALFHVPAAWASEAEDGVRILHLKPEGTGVDLDPRTELLSTSGLARRLVCGAVRAEIVAVVGPGWVERCGGVAGCWVTRSLRELARHPFDAGADVQRGVLAPAGAAAEVGFAGWLLLPDHVTRLAARSLTEDGSPVSTLLAVPVHRGEADLARSSDGIAVRESCLGFMQRAGLGWDVLTDPRRPDFVVGTKGGGGTRAEFDQAMKDCGLDLAVVYPDVPADVRRRVVERVVPRRGGPMRVVVPPDQVDVLLAEVTAGPAVALTDGTHTLTVHPRRGTVNVHRDRGDGQYQLVLSEDACLRPARVPPGTSPVGVGSLSIWPTMPADPLDRLQQLAYFALFESLRAPGTGGKKPTPEQLDRAARFAASARGLLDALAALDPADPAAAATRGLGVLEQARALLSLHGEPANPEWRDVLSRRAAADRRSVSTPPAAPAPVRWPLWLAIGLGALLILAVLGGMVG